MITEAEWGQSKGPTHKVKALFALLVTRGAHGASKDEIVELLWGNQSAGEKSDARFHAALYYLRRALEPDLPPRIDSQFVIYQEGNYKLAPPDGYWLDAAAFEDYYNYALRLDEEGQPEVAARYYRMSEALYQGDYMAGLSPSYTEDYVNDCCQSQRHRLKDMNLIVLLRLAHYYLLHSQDHLSLQYAHKALTQDRACEEAHRLVMKLMHRAGHPRELARQYRSCERSLVESEDRGPSSKTAQLYQQFLQTP